MVSRKAIDHSAIVDHAAEDEHAVICALSSKKIALKNPSVIAGFPDNGMVASISLNHVIEQLRMHQVAFVDSPYIMASALYIGKKIRHPFRVYANDAGTACVLVCEVPVLARGIRSIVNALVDWLISNKIADLTVMGGIPPTNVSPSHGKPRTALILYNFDDADPESKFPDSFDQTKVAVPSTAFVVGMAGALLVSCVANKVKCRGMFVPSIGATPDPGGAAVLLESLSKIAPLFQTNTASLEAEAEMIKKQLEELLRMQQEAMAESEQPAIRPEAERIYK